LNDGDFFEALSGDMTMLHHALNRPMESTHIRSRRPTLIWINLSPQIAEISFAQSVQYRSPFGRRGRRPCH
jgi:hypothetical protein